MAISAASPSSPFPLLYSRSSSERQQPRRIPSDETLKSRLLRKGVEPTPKILHTLRKKETLKSLRRAKKEALSQSQSLPPLSESQKQALAEDEHFRTILAEYRDFKKELAGKPWERSNGGDLKGMLGSDGGDCERRLRGEHLAELREMLKERNRMRFSWILDDDVDLDEDLDEGRDLDSIRLRKRLMGDEERVQLLVKRLSNSDMSLRDWSFLRLMKQSDILFNEMNLLKILEGLEDSGSWRQALSVVQWVYNEKEYKHRKSRFVYTKLLSVLGKARRPTEALQIFTEMRGDAQIYPDMAAYHTIAVTLGQAGRINELTKIIEFMRQKPSKDIRNNRRKNWDPSLEPDLIVYNAVLNGCIPSSQWKGVFWVFKQLRAAGLKPNGASYGLAMEVMLNAGKYGLVHKFFEKMKKNGLAIKAITHKVLVRCLWKEGKIDEAVEAVREMERRGVVGESSIYYELACCLCNNGRLQDSFFEIENMKKFLSTKPLEVAFTGMITESFKGGYIDNCISIFETMKNHCAPNIGTINAMLRVYGRSDMFARARQLFESISTAFSLKPDLYSYSSMLEASANSMQWEYFEFVYREMVLSGFYLGERKNEQLLVQASKYGKWCLLEHAFNATLDRGEIPCVSMFTELICQSISQYNFAWTVSLINGMAYASIKFNESQWTNIFSQNTNRFGDYAFNDLFNYINSNSNLVSEEPALSFLTYLQSLCGKKLLIDSESKCQEPKILECIGTTGLKIEKFAEERKFDWICDSNNSVVDEVLESLTVNIGGLFEGLPSAKDILKKWNNEGIKEDI